MITAERVRELIHYDAETGVFTWRYRMSTPKGRRWSGRYGGKVAGAFQSMGYWTIAIESRGYLAHRLAWLYVTGEWPTDQIDHVDGDRLNNKFANLRLASSSQNACNSGKKPANTSGAKGVTWFKRDGTWRAQIMVDGRHYHLGYFLSVNEAAAAYVEAAGRLHGAFAHTG